MRPDDQNNYWAKNADEADDDKISGVYTPVDDDSVAPVDNQMADSEIDSDDDETVHWAASEYINNEKNGLWFAMLGVIAVAFIATDILFLKAYTFSILIIVMVFAIIVFSRRPPRQINYTLSGQQGLYIGEKLYHFGDFKSFGVIKDKENNSIILIPVKRFSPSVTVYFPQEVGEELVDILGARLPMQEVKLDIIDIIVQKLRL